VVTVLALLLRLMILAFLVYFLGSWLLLGLVLWVSEGGLRRALISSMRALRDSLLRARPRITATRRRTHVFRARKIVLKI
jgi:hypothetical protein